MTTTSGLAAAALLASLLVLAPATAASHAEDSLPADDGNAAVQAGLGWLEEHRTDEDSGCIHARDGTCMEGAVKWVAATLAFVGVDPGAWPSAEASVLGWMLAHADNLHDHKYKSRSGCGGEDDSSFCQVRKVNSLAKTVFAFRAGGEDPAAIPHPNETDEEIDFVQRLLDTHDGDQFGSSSHVNDDIWGLIALHSVGYDGPEVQSSADFVASTQGPMGGYGYDEGTGSSADTTAAAIMALAPLDREENVEDALAYLEQAQIQEGETRACWGRAPNADEGNAASTSWAIQGLIAAREDPVAWSVADRTPLECLRTFQESKGGFANTHDTAENRGNTQQAIAALSWVPYGSLTQPNQPLTVHDEATVGEEHTATLPGGVLRIGEESLQQHTWTPEETGRRTFHGFTWDPPRPASLVVEVREAEDTASSSGSTSSSSSGSESSSSGTGSSSDAGDPPEVAISAPTRAERNVSFTVNVSASPGDAPVTGFRLEAGERPATDWQPAGTFEVELAKLGEQTIKAWARDAEGRVSEPASSVIEVVDAAPRVEIAGPALVNRSTPITFEAEAGDPDGPRPNVTWRRPRGDVANGSTATFAFQDPGEHALEAEARDAAGNTVNATWTVQARNRAPVNLTVHPGQLEANATEIVRAEARDPDGDPLEVAWQRPGEPGSRSWGSQRHVETAGPGEHVLLVNVSDSYGGWTQARLVLPVRETPEDDGEPVLETLATQTSGTIEPASRPTQPPDPATIELPETITAQANRSRLLEAQAHSPNGAVLNVTVELGGPLPARGTDEVTALLPELPPGEYELAARAADRAGWGPWSNAKLVVEPAPEKTELEPAGGPSPERSTPLGILVACASLALAARRRRP